MEGRHTRRLVRYWVFLSIAYLLGIGSYVYYGVLHAFFSSFSASVGMIGPRYLLYAIGLYYLMAFVIGIIFLGFDVRARDVREGIVEVLDSQPLTNLELVAGRFVALFLAGWVPIVILALLIQTLGWLLPLLGSPVGRTVEPMSLLYLVVLMSVPALAFAIAGVFVITLLVRQRLLAALISIAALAATYWLMFTVTVPYAPLPDFLGMTQSVVPSDIVPGLALPGGGVQRLGFLVLAIALLGIAAAIHPRLDGGSRRRTVAVSGALALGGVLLLGLTVQQRLGEADRVDVWRDAHAARSDEPVADIVSIRGAIEVAPGRTLAADLVVEVEAPQPQERLLFTLNPGLEVEDVRAADGAVLEATQADGLLDIRLANPLAAGERTALTLRYRGRPDSDFGYLDSALQLDRLKVGEAQIGILGYQSGVFARRHVALMPGNRWLPAAGSDVGRDDPRSRSTDYFDVALDVALPAGWLAAGPAKRQTVSATGDTVVYRFAPPVAVPEVAIVAGELASFATEIDGVWFEVLVDPAHTDNFAVLAHARDEIEQWIGDHLEVAAAAGLEYPFDAFTIVEVPNTLRGFAGGWRLDTTLAPPGMMLLRETSFPTARFDFDVVRMFGNRNLDQEGGAARIDRDRLVNFFSNDFSGGNVFSGAARSFFAHRTSAAGENGIALDFVLEELATLFVSGQRSYFSAHLFQSINQTATSVVNGLGNASSIADSLISTRTAQHDVWEHALEAPLTGLDPWEDPQRTIDILTLKGGEMAQAIYDTLGAQAVGELLAGLLERSAGASFTFDDVAAVSEQLDPSLPAMLADWLGSTGMAGFVAERVDLYRLADASDGGSRYQLIVRIANQEPVVGFARVAWAMERGGDRAFGEPVRISGGAAIEYGVVLSQPPAVVYVHPYLSLNRENFLAGLTDAVEIPSRDLEPFNGVRDALLEGGADARLVADDLDPGFMIVDDDAGTDMRLAGRGAPAAGLDNGLPVATGSAAPRNWSRRANETAWGRYRHTTTYVGAGSGMRRAVLPVSVPSAGLWELELHLPFLPFLAPNDRGTWQLTIVSDAGRENVGFDARAANLGWNLVGEFELPAGEVRVELSDETDGRMVIADAIGWSPLRQRGTAASATSATSAASEESAQNAAASVESAQSAAGPTDSAQNAARPTESARNAAGPVDAAQDAADLAEAAR